ncbi:hypothetical protein AVEN_225219-1 [Araneus ventricosus]|uniref:Uncharacterized protein n=1 Tax=Araneus ventricosus TaxID=182803 RepID=A0A4Y2AL85_ARAVE|nr:hypothetical protein AVEN_225219-1 [Araneus ventricosus]
MSSLYFLRAENTGVNSYTRLVIFLPNGFLFINSAHKEFPTENKSFDLHRQRLTSFQQFTMAPSGKDSRTSDCCGSTAHLKRSECFRSTKHPISMKIFHVLFFMDCLARAVLFPGV